jgi:hypothetical protein
MLMTTKHGGVKRGCLLAATLLAAAICAGASLLHFYVFPRKLRYDSSAIALKLEEGLDRYRADFGAYPEGNSAALLDVLLGENTRNRAYIDPRFRSQIDPAGQVTDVWGRPLRFENLPGGPPRVLSPGKNGVFGDSDDIDSSLAKRIATKAAPAPPSEP